MSPGTPKVLTIKVRSATFAGANGQSFAVTAQIDPDNRIPELNEANNSDQIHTFVVKRPDLIPDAAGLPLTSTGLELTYPIKIRNTGDGSAANVITRISLPREVDFVRADASQLGTCVVSGTAGPQGGQKVTCTLPSMPGNSEASVRIVTRPIQGLLDGAQILLSFIVDPDNLVAERNEANNTAGAITKVSLPVDLEITTVTVVQGSLPTSAADPRNGLPAAASCGFQSDLVVRVRVANRGPGQSAPTVVRIRWALGIQLESFSACPGGSHCDQGVCVVGAAATPPARCFDVCSVANLLPNESTEVTFHAVRNGVSGDFGVAEVTPPANDPNRANNSKHIIG